MSESESHDPQPTTPAAAGPEQPGPTTPQHQPQQPPSPQQPPAAEAPQGITAPGPQAPNAEATQAVPPPPPGPSVPPPVGPAQPGPAGRFFRHRATQLVGVGIVGLILGGGVVGAVAHHNYERPGISRDGHYRHMPQNGPQNRGGHQWQNGPGNQNGNP